MLVRAVEPLEGVDAMRARRGQAVKDRDLARGPGRLTQALAITRKDDRAGLLGRGARVRLLAPPKGGPTFDVDVGPRIGITKDVELPLRFRIAGSRWTS